MEAEAEGIYEPRDTQGGRPLSEAREAQGGTLLGVFTETRPGCHLGLRHPASRSWGMDF